jgi:hypothetical protein
MHKKSLTTAVICDSFLNSKPVYKNSLYPWDKIWAHLGAAAPSLGTTGLNDHQTKRKWGLTSGITVSKKQIQHSAYYAIQYMRIMFGKLSVSVA